MNTHTPISETSARQVERSLEVLVYYVTLLALFFSYFPLGIAVNHAVINITVIISFFWSIVAYRLMPVQYRGVRFSYTFELKSFVVIVGDMILASAVIASTGGADSPFLLLYGFLIMASALLLHAIHLYVLIPLNIALLAGAAVMANPDKVIEPHLLISIALLIMMYWLGVIIIRRRARHE